MLNVEATARSLADEKTTVAMVAQTLGHLAERRTAYFKLAVDDPHVESAHIGMTAGGAADAAPEYVELYFRFDHSVPLSAAVPFCKEWKLTPANSKASPWYYSCPFPGSTPSIKVVLFASLTGEIGTPAARLVKLLLQRNDWRQPFNLPPRGPSPHRASE